MSSGQEFWPSQQLADDVDAMIRDRIETARPLERLSGHDEIVLQVVEEADGRKFVTRTFSHDAVADIESWSERSFAESWNRMRQTFESAGLPPVRTEIAINDPDSEAPHPVVMVSEYLADSKPIAEACTETKLELARKLPLLFDGSGGLMVHSPVIQRDMFRFVTTESGEEQVFLMDVDPRMVRPFSRHTADSLRAVYVRAFGEYFWDEWCNPEERTEVLAEFVRSAGPLLKRQLDDSHNPVFEAFFDVHSLAQGFDPRQLRS